jgi:diadenosine tetraphosphatase ApaH/serine/threonine PP2A family protein phosphatase
MKYAILGDIHANLEALTAVLNDARAQGVEKFVSTGDIVGYGASPSECIEILREINCEIVQGNHDYYAACEAPMRQFAPSASRTVLWTRTKISPEQKIFLSNLPLIKQISNFTICHSSLSNPTGWNYILDRESARRSLLEQKSQICFVSHTHVPLLFIETDAVKMCRYEKFYIKSGEKYIINPGSVGQPRDDNPLTAYTIYDSYKQCVLLRRIPYDIKTSQEKILAAGLPEKNANRLSLGR